MNDYLIFVYSINKMSELHCQAEKERLIREYCRPGKINVFSWVMGIILVCLGIALFIS